MFLSKPKYIISLVYPGSAFGSAPRKHPGQIPEPPQLASHNAEEQQIHLELTEIKITAQQIIMIIISFIHCCGKVNLLNYVYIEIVEREANPSLTQANPNLN